ncbi:hypothetical protein BLSTO_01791 [Blastocystis sp. subtype 1]
MSQDTVIPEKELETVDPHESESPPPQGCRCIQVVSRRHSIDVDGCILSDSVSKSRTPRPAVSADVEMDANEENGEQPRRKLSLSETVKETWKNVSVLFSP